MQEIYLDNNATAPLAIEVMEEMVAALRDCYGNPSSGHSMGVRAKKALETARERVAGLLGAAPDEIVFNSGGTEGNNAAIRAALDRRPRRRIVVSAVEHPAVLRPAERLVERGFELKHIPVHPTGEIDMEAARALIDPDTALVSVMAANNETGVLMPFDAIAELAAENGALVHVDAVQAVSRVPLDTRRTPVDFVTLSGHKLHAPKGIGATYVRRGRRLRALVLGGEQERGQRGGTQNVPGAMGLGKACELLMGKDQTPVAALRDRLERELLSRVPGARVNGAGAPRLPNTLSIGFLHVEAEALVHALSQKGICVSTGSACTSGSLEPSHVLKAMAVPTEYAHGTVRFSLSLFTTPREVEKAIDAVPAIVDELRALSPLWDGPEETTWRS